MAQCATTALAGAVPRLCVRGACGRFGGLGPVPDVVSLPFPPSRPACPALRVAGRPVRVSLTLAGWYAIPRGRCVPRARSVCLSGSPRVPFACVCARAPAASAQPPPWVVWPAHLARSRHWALVGPFHVVRAPLRVLPRSRAPSGVLGGVRCGPGSCLPGLGLCAPQGAGLWRSCAGGRVGGGGGACAVPPLCAAGGASRAGGRSASFRPSAFPGQATKRVSLASFWSWGAAQTSPVRARPPSLGAICAASWRVGAGSLDSRGSCGSRRLGRGGGPCSSSSLGRGEGGLSPLPQGVGAGAPAACGLVGGTGGGGVAPRPPCSPSGGRPAVPYPGPPLVVGALPPGVRVRSGSRGCPGGGGDEGRPVDHAPGGPFRPEPPLCPSRVGNGHGGGHGGRGLHTVLMRRRAPPQGLVRAPLRRAGVGSHVGRDPRGSRRLGDWGARCAGPAASPPPRCGPFWGRGGVPSAPGGRRVAPVALKLGKGKGKVLGRSPNSSVSVIPTCPKAQHATSYYTHQNSCNSGTVNSRET